MSQILFNIHGGLPDITNPPQPLWTTANRPYLAFDDTNDELFLVTFPVPEDFASGLNINVGFSMPSLTSGVVRVRSQIMAAAAGVNVDTDSFAALEDSGDVTIPGTAGDRAIITYAPSNTDGIAADSHCAIIVGRENATTGTNVLEDMHWWDFWLTYTAS